MAEIKPVTEPGIWAGSQQPYGSWLFGGLTLQPNGQYSMNPSPGYGGPLTPDVANTNLPNVWGAWNPQGDQGQQFLLNYLQAQNPLNSSPLLQNAMQYGGQGGPGNVGMSNLLQFGTPSEAGNPQSFLAQHGVANPEMGVLMDSLAQNGFSSQASGGALARLAAGDPNGAGNALIPFLAAQNKIQAPPVAYQAPPIPGLNTTRQVP